MDQVFTMGLYTVLALASWRAGYCYIRTAVTLYTLLTHQPAIQHDRLATWEALPVQSGGHEQRVVN